jgi:hypothetical protein
VNAKNRKFYWPLDALGKKPQDNQPSSCQQNQPPQNTNEQRNLEEEAVVGGRLISTQPICSEIGVGIHQGEAISIQRWGLSFGELRPTWMICNLQSESLSQIPKELFQQLRFVSCFLEECYKQPSLWKNYSLLKDGGKVSRCYQSLAQHEYKTHPSEAEKSMVATETTERQEKSREQSKLGVCSKCPLWQFLHPELEGATPSVDNSPNGKATSA